ncbi:MAG: ferritin [Thermoplasmata archaeon]
MPRYESDENISEDVKDLSRARQSLIEEVEAIMFYDERADVTEDKELKYIMMHNRDDEKEHFAMILEYLRRKDPQLDKELKENLFSKKKLDKLGD